MSARWDDWKRAAQNLRETLAGRYTLGSLFDRGGVAEIYLARRVDAPEIQVAIKILRPILSLDDQIAAMFEDEIALFQQLSHPHVVLSLEGQPKSRPPYLMMEYIHGCNLARFHEWLQTKNEPPPWPLAFEIASAILKALHYLHHTIDSKGKSLKLVHRDLSPPNVLLGRGGEIKLTDFGIAIYQDMCRKTQGKDPKGKFSYIAPEMLLGLPIDQRADLFSWGIITWELLTGHRLFASSTPEGTLKLVSDAPILSPRTFNPDIPHEFEKIVMKALQRDREQRYQNTHTLHDALSNIKAPPSRLGKWVLEMLSQTQETYSPDENSRKCDK